MSYDGWLFRLSSESTAIFREDQQEITVSDRLLVLSGRVIKGPHELHQFQDAHEIVRVLMEMSGPWSVVYFRPDLKRLFVGRDVFGRLSLVCAADLNDIVIAETVKSVPKDGWCEVPYAQISCINTDNRSVECSSYISEYPEGVMECWQKLFTSTVFRCVPIKNDLLQLSRNSSSDDDDVLNEFLERLVASTSSMIPEDSSSLGVAFSGGVDSLLVAIALHKAYESERTIDLVNVAFIRGCEHRSIVTDRQRAITGFSFLRSKFPARRWRLIEADITKEEMEKNRVEHIVKAAAPASSVLDESLACVLWFALRGIGNDHESKREVRSEADECEAELRRLGSRNGGRDARVAVILNKELRAPLLHDDFVSWANAIPPRLKWNLSLPRGVGEKLIIRKVLAALDAPHTAPKQAMQFGSGFVKMQSDKTIKGSDTSRHLLNSPSCAVSTDS
ncbi:hypothetical protein Q1695_007123 [Nippostrongylus brasiliensis]|nr:hypothetical protein Q1695_007123 [Nippostrongylus brasiliensis]